MSMKRCLITGGAGFIGSNLAIKLVHRGCSVRVMDNLHTGRFENLAPVFDDLETLRGDIRDLECVRAAVKGVDTIFHQAALVSVAGSITDPIACHECNVTGMLNVLVAARDAGVRRVVFASSSAVYGDAGLPPLSESAPPSPVSPYATAKLVDEFYARNFYELYGLETVGLRYFNVFGPRQDPNSEYAAVIPKFTTSLLDGKPPVVYGDGEQSRDFVFVSDVARANILAAEAPSIGGEVFNIGTGNKTTLNDLIDILGQILSATARPVYEARRPGDIVHSWADIGKASQMLGYEPSFGLEEGLRETVDWFTCLAKGEKAVATSHDVSDTHSP